MGCRGPRDGLARPGDCAAGKIGQPHRHKRQHHHRKNVGLDRGEDREDEDVESGIAAQHRIVPRKRRPVEELERRIPVPGGRLSHEDGHQDNRDGPHPPQHPLERRRWDDKRQASDLDVAPGRQATRHVRVDTQPQQGQEQDASAQKDLGEQRRREHRGVAEGIEPQVVGIEDGGLAGGPDGRHDHGKENDDAEPALHDLS